MCLAIARASLWKANPKFAYYRDDSNAVQHGKAVSSTWTTERGHLSVA